MTDQPWRLSREESADEDDWERVLDVVRTESPPAPSADLGPAILDRFDQYHAGESRPIRRLRILRRTLELVAAGFLVAGAMWLRSVDAPATFDSGSFGSEPNVQYLASAVELDTEILDARLGLLAARVDSLAARVSAEDRASTEVLALRSRSKEDPWDRFETLAADLPSALPLVSAALLEVESPELARSRYRDLIRCYQGDPVADVATARLRELGP